MKQKKNNKSIIIILIIIMILFILVLLLFSIINSLNNQNDNKKIEDIKQYTSINDFKSIEEVAIYLDCTYIKEETSKQENYNIDIYMKIKILPYTDDKSNEGFYDKLISYSAKVLKFANFRIIDKENDITIEVVCDKENETIQSIIINGESDYFTKRESELQIKNYQETKITDFTIQSDIINKLINNNWRILDSELGSKESTFNSYDIYFDEGIEVRKINNQVFNIVFTDKYVGNLVNNITTSTSKEEIINILGEPTFEDAQTDVIGYKGKDIYVFFNTESQISIYRVEKNEIKSEISDLINKYNDETNNTKLIEEMKEIWNEYDKYKTTEYSIELRYTFRGLQINSDTIKIYSNYVGKIYNDKTLVELMEQNAIPEQVIYINKDLIFITEVDRNKSINSTKYALNNYSSVVYEDDIQEITSREFLQYKTYLSEDTFTVQFVSKTRSIPNSELKEAINSGTWINDNVYVYGINNKGLYAYNAKTREYATLLTGNENFNIVQYEDYILKYDDTELRFKK